ncbi:hypothetical protein [Veillonella criceti]|nr:hypothetical protein [Veillonella criceti]
MTKLSKLILMVIMSVLVLAIAGCGSSESDNFTGKWITKNPKTNVTVLDIQPKKDKQMVIKSDVYSYQDKISKESRQRFSNDIHIEYLNTLIKNSKNEEGHINKNKLITEEATYVYNEEEKTITIDNVVYTKYTDDKEFNNKLQDLRPLKEQEIKDRTKNDNMFTHYYDKFDYDDSVLNK